jgi:hypothetical protein
LTTDGSGGIIRKLAPQTPQRMVSLEQAMEALERLSAMDVDARDA